jgi:hypothetical protein
MIEEEKNNYSVFHGLWTLASRELKKWYKGSSDTSPFINTANILDRNIR